jgi:hypothetical protein
LALIQNEYPDFDEASFIHLRIEYVSVKVYFELPRCRNRELSNLEAKVIGSLNEDKSLVNTVEDEIGVRTVGQK